MNPFFLSLMSGPLMAALRYAVTAGASAVVAKGWTDGATATTVGAGIIAAASAGIGVLTSTKTAKLVNAAEVPGVKLTLPNGRSASSGPEVINAIQALDHAAGNNS